MLVLRTSFKNFIKKTLIYREIYIVIILGDLSCMELHYSFTNYRCGFRIFHSFLRSISLASLFAILSIFG